MEESKIDKGSVELVIRMELQGQAVDRDMLQEEGGDVRKCTSRLEGDQDSSCWMDT